MPVFKYLDISTGHLPASDRLMMNYGEAPVICRLYTYGWLVYVPSDDTELNEAIALDMTHCAVAASPYFFQLLRYARQLDCNWIMLDQDGEIEHALPWFGDGDGDIPITAGKG